MDGGQRVRGRHRDDEPPAGSRLDAVGDLLRLAAAQVRWSPPRRGVLHPPRARALILALSAVFLASHPPDWILGAAAGAGAAVPAVALSAAWRLVPASRDRLGSGNTRQVRWALYALVGGAAAATVGAYLVLVILACGLTEIVIRQQGRPWSGSARAFLPALIFHGTGVGGLGALVWVAFKVGALSYGGGFVIVPLMQHDVVVTYHWMTGARVPQRRGARPDHPGPGGPDDGCRRVRGRRFGRGSPGGPDCLCPFVRLRARRRSALRPDPGQQLSRIVSDGSGTSSYRSHRRVGDSARLDVPTPLADTGACRCSCVALCCAPGCCERAASCRGRRDSRGTVRSPRVTRCAHSS